MSNSKIKIMQQDLINVKTESRLLSYKWLRYLTIIILTLISFSNSLTHNNNLDDDFIYNSLPKPADGFSGIFSVFNMPYNFSDYRPFTILSFALQQIFVGLDPVTSHAVNLILYLILCISIFFILSRLPVPNIDFIALAAVLLFCVHTSHSEVVCSIKNRDNILSMLLGMWSLFFFIRYNTTTRLLYYALGFLYLFAAILSKRDAYVFLLIIPFTLFVFYGTTYKKLLAIGIVFLIIIVIVDRLSGRAIMLQETTYSASISFTENPNIHPSILNKISQGIQSAGYYLKFMLLPTGYYYYFGYDMIPLKNLFSPDILFLFFIHLSLMAVAFYNYKRNKLLFFGILFFYFSLSYCLNIIVPVSGIVSVRFGFISSLGFCIMAAVLIFSFSEKMKTNKFIMQLPFIKLFQSNFFGAFLLCSILYYLPFTISRNKDWKDIFTLIKTDIKSMNKSFQGSRIAATHVLYSAIQEKDNTNKKALLKQALQFSLNARNLSSNDDYVNNITGQAYYYLNNFPAAKTVFMDNLSKNDTSIMSLEYLGNMYFENEEKYDSSALFYKKIIDIRPGYKNAYFKYLSAAYKSGRKKEILDYFSTLYSQKKQSYIPAQCLAFYYFFEKDSTTGMQYYKESFKQGYVNINDAVFTRQYFIRHNDTKSAQEMYRYIPNNL